MAINLVDYPYYKVTETSVGEYIYEYMNIHLHSEYNQLEILLNSLKSIENSSILLPGELSYMDNVLSLTYPKSKEGHYLFHSLYCRKYSYTSREGALFSKKVVGSYIHALLGSTRINIALKLCEIFDTLNKNEVYIQNYNDGTILYDLENDRLLVDLVPLVLPINEELQEIVAEIIPECVLFCPKEKGYNENTNNYYLTFILYKLLIGNIDFASLPLNRIHEMCNNGDLSIVLPQSKFFEKYFQNLNESVQCLNQDISLETIAYPSPGYWRKRLLENRCTCGDGLFGLLDEWCNSCGKECFGKVTFRETGHVQPLVGVSKQSSLPPKSEEYIYEDVLIFKVLQGTTDNCFRSALLFPKHELVEVFNEEDDEWYEHINMNSKGTYKMYELNSNLSHISFKVRNVILDFEFSHLINEEI